MKTIEQVLQQKFGFQSFRPGQKETIMSILAGRHTLSMLPTGTGKSLCYQLPAYWLPGAVVVVSPLLSLMQDQTEKLKLSGEKRVVALNSFLQYQEKREALENLQRYKFIFASPEMLQIPSVLQALKQRGISLFVIDEAHCISQWGFDFRPDYGLLGQVRLQLGEPLTLALTATATQKVREDIKTILNLSQADEWVFSVNRPNIALRVELTEDYLQKQTRLGELVRFLKKPGIVYFSSRKAAEEAAFFLKQNSKERVAFYHGGMEAGERLLIQHQFLNEELDVVCATSAFGMGINKENVRFVIHFHMPAQLESYLQEIGRAGRDGFSSIAILLFSPQDEKLHEWMAEGELPSFEQIQQAAVLESLNAVYPPLSETQERFLLHYLVFAKEQKKNPAAYIQQVRDSLLKKKEMDRLEMTSWVYSTSCRRAHYMRYFDEAPVRQALCCDRCGFPIEEFRQTEPRKTAEKPLHWRMRLAHLLPPE